MNRKKFFEKVNGFVSGGEWGRISHAYWIAKEAHRAQKRDCGERYFEHARRVACILIDRGGVSADEIIISLLHDCIEDTWIPGDLIGALFGVIVAESVEILTKIIPLFDEATGAVKEKKKKDSGAYYRAIADAHVSARRVKLADRLDNVRSMGVWPDARIQKYIMETERYVLPIAHATDRWFAEEIGKELKKYMTH